MTFTLSDTSDLPTLASSLLSATPPASLIKPLRRSDSLLSLDHEQWIEKAAALKDQLDQLTTDFTSSSIATALYHAFLLISRAASAAPDRDAPAGISLDTLESAVIWRLPAAKQAQVWLTAYVLTSCPSIVSTAAAPGTAAAGSRVRKLPQDAVDPSALYDRLAPGIQALVDGMSLEGICGLQSAGPSMRLRSAAGGYLGAHLGVYWADRTAGGGVYAFVHSAADADQWGWDMKGLGWRVRPVVRDGEVVFEVECAGEGGPGGERGRYLAVVDAGAGHWVGVVNGEEVGERTYWRVLPSPTNADQVVLQHFTPMKKRQGQTEEPMYVSMASQARRDANSVYLELSTTSPISFDLEVLHA